MINLRIPIHSFVDVITNSSTEIFVGSNKKSIEVMKELINSILKESGSDKKADDLFEFQLIIAEKDIISAADFYADEQDLSYEDGLKKFKQGLEEGIINISNYIGEEDKINNTLIMKSKIDDSVVTNLTEILPLIVVQGERSC